MTILQIRVPRLERAKLPPAELLTIVRQIVDPGRIGAAVTRAECFGEHFVRCADESEEQFVARVAAQVAGLHPAGAVPRVLLFSDAGQPTTAHAGGLANAA